MAASTVTSHPQVGVPDSDLETSPIIEGDELLEVEPNVSGGGCKFNGVTHEVGRFVVSGNELLRCERPGVWVRVGEWPPLGLAR